MKILTLLFAILLATNVSAQPPSSLADLTGEKQSLYNAVCIIYDVKPDSIGMKEGRKLMQEYAESIGLKYELYEFNAGNNLYILYYKSSVNRLNQRVIKQE